MELVFGLAIVAVVYFIFFRKKPSGNGQTLENQGLSSAVNHTEKEAHQRITRFVNEVARSADPKLADEKRQGVADDATNALFTGSKVVLPDPNKDALMALLLRAAVFDTISPTPPISVYKGLRKQTEQRIRDGGIWPEDEILAFFEKADTYSELCRATASFGQPKYIDVQAFLDDIVNKA